MRAPAILALLLLAPLAAADAARTLPDGDAVEVRWASAATILVPDRGTSVRDEVIHVENTADAPIRNVTLVVVPDGFPERWELQSGPAPLDPHLGGPRAVTWGRLNASEVGAARLVYAKPETHVGAFEVQVVLVYEAPNGTLVEQTATLTGRVEGEPPRPSLLTYGLVVAGFAVFLALAYVMGKKRRQAP